MATKIFSSHPGFGDDLKSVINIRMVNEEEVSGVVSKIISDVRIGGDNSLIEYTRKFDKFVANIDNIMVTKAEIDEALTSCDIELLGALKFAAERVRSYSEKQLPQNLDYTDNLGTRLGHRWTPISSVGLYVPGGTAAYPSSVLMNAIPAQVAGVKRLVMAVPAPNGELDPALLVAAKIAGIDEIYRMGGAQAIAALTYGTQTIIPVDKIVGPGNAYVAEAKRQVFGKVGIDMIAGPSEILVIADGKNNPEWIAADLLSQAEHDVLSQSILVTDSEELADKVFSAVKNTIPTLARQEIAKKSWDNYGAVIVVKDMEEAAEISNMFAPEHLELAVENPDSILPLIRHAGAIFMGRITPEAIGDYIAGPSHVLPTSRTARFSSGLSVFDFLKRTSVIGCNEKSFSVLSEAAKTIADAEGLQAHKLSMSIRG